MTYVVHFWFIFVSCGPCVRSRARPCAAICYSSFLDHFWRISAPPPRAGCACGAVRVGPCVQGRAGPCVVHLLHIFGVFLMNFWRISGPLPACGPCVRGRACGTCVRPCQTVRGAFSDTFWFIFVSCGPCVRAGPCQAVRGYFVVSFLGHFWSAPRCGPCERGRASRAVPGRTWPICCACLIHV